MQPQETYKQIVTKKNIYQTGKATWYGLGFDCRKTASGEIFDMYDFTAAHRDLQLGTIIRVTNIENHNFAIVRINDRGPVNKSLIIDLSKVVAIELDIVRVSSGNVEIEILSNSTNPLEKIFQVCRNIGNN